MKDINGRENHRDPRLNGFGIFGNHEFNSIHDDLGESQDLEDEFELWLEQIDTHQHETTDWMGQDSQGEFEVHLLAIKQNPEAFSVLIRDAQRLKASDIHVEPGIKHGRIRFRVDGQLVIVFTIAMDEYGCLINRIKVKAHLDIAEKRLPQDGRIEWEGLDLRVSTIPVMYGEKLVMRLLQKDSDEQDLASLGMTRQQLGIFTNALARTHGLLLISGPTGSGKTTTLYAAIKALNRPGINILTAEDPIEYSIPGIAQVQVKPKIGLSFATILRSFLRQDPDIIMVGEIRDSETASIAIRAALTGHLVLSTLHTNSSIEAITRLRDMGIAPYLIEDTLVSSLAQRLVRKLCIHCKKPMENRQWIFEESGCEHCHYTGYNGRTGVFEIVNGIELIKAILDDQKASLLLGSRMADQAGNLVLNGITSPSEYKRVIGEEFGNHLKD